MPSPPNRESGAAWRPLVVCPQARMAQRVVAALRDVALDPAATLSEYPRMGSFAGIVRENGCDVCFLDVASNPEHAQLLISELAPAVPVVVLHNRADADLILRCIRRGACEFLTDPTADALRSLFTRLCRARMPAPAPSDGAVITVIPGKAGSGASTLAAHVAIHLAAGGDKVLLVDGDSMYASIAFLLKLKPEYHLGDVLRDWNRMDNDLWARLTLPSNGIDVLAAPANPAARTEVNPQAAGELWAFWRERYRVVVLDMADARAASESGFAGLSDVVLLVAANELGSLQATRRAVEYLEQSMTDRARLRLILNRTTPSKGLRLEDVRGALGLEPYAVLGDDWSTLQSALLEGRPAPAASRFAQGVHALCRKLRSQQLKEQDPEEARPAKKNGTWFSFRRQQTKA